jgi:hypothetical protein
MPSHDQPIPDVPDHVSNGDGGFSVLAEANAMNSTPAPQMKEKKKLFGSLRKSPSNGEGNVGRSSRSNSPAPSVSVKPIVGTVAAPPRDVVVPAPVAAVAPAAPFVTVSAASPASVAPASGAGEFATNKVPEANFSSVPRTKPIPVIETPAVMARPVSSVSLQKTVTVTPQASAKALD